MEQSFEDTPEAISIVALGELVTGLAHPDLGASFSEPRPTTRHGRCSEYRHSHSWTLQRIQAFPYLLRDGPVHGAQGHANGAVMCGVISAQQGWQNVHETPGPVGRHVAMNHALQRPLEALHHGTLMSSFSLVKKCMSLDLSSRLKRAAHILVPLSLCTASGGLSCISSRMACMAPAVSVPHLLVRGPAQAYLENTSMQQKRYLVLSLASQYSLQSIRLHSPGPDTMVCRWGKR